MNFKETYGRFNEAVIPAPELTDSLIAKAAKRNRNRTYRSWYRVAAAILICCTVLRVSMPVLAAHVEPVYQFLYRLSPEAAQHLMPVQMASEDQGIRMEVVSACIYEDTARIYITMEDLEGDRIDETTDLFDSYSINRPFDSIGTCEWAGYDAESGKVSFLITLQEQPWEQEEHLIQGDKITFSVREFLSHKTTYEDIIIPVDLKDIPSDVSTRIIASSGHGGDFESYETEDTTEVLIPNCSVDIIPDNDITLTALGYQDGMLHIQTAFGNTLEHDNHGFLWLEDADGKRNSAYNIYFRDNTDPEHPVTYEEEVFDISLEELSGCTLHGDYVISGQKTEGNWRVTFPLE